MVAVVVAVRVRVGVVTVVAVGGVRVVAVVVMVVVRGVPAHHGAGISEESPSTVSRLEGHLFGLGK